MTRAQFERIVSDIDREGSYPWKHELHDLWDHDQAQREEIARLREALTSIAKIRFLLGNDPRLNPAYEMGDLAQVALTKESARDKAG